MSPASSGCVSLARDAGRKHANFDASRNQFRIQQLIIWALHILAARVSPPSATVSHRRLQIWKKTDRGNYSNGVASRWKRLLARIGKDVAEFPSYSFGKLRKTAATRMLELHDAEAASMLLAHGTPTEDKILKAYVNIPWQKLYAAQDSYGDTIRPLLDKIDSLEQPPKNYIGLTKSERIIAEYHAGVPVKQIAENVGVSSMTVYRHLDRSGVRQ